MKRDLIKILFLQKSLKSRKVRYFNLFFIFFISCSLNNNTNLKDCLYPEESLVLGGIVNRAINKDSISDINLNSKFLCEDSKNLRLIYPISYYTDNNIKIGSIKIQLTEKEFRDSRITIKDQKFNFISKENLNRITKERETLHKYTNLKSSRKYLKLPFKIPLEGIISSEYGVKRFINEKPRNPHLGVDFAANEGSKIFSPENGLVVYTGNFFYRGNIIIIDHGDEVISTYSHLHEINVKRGTDVSKGDFIGTVGSTGRVTGPHLHFEIILKGVKIDPSIFLY